MSRPPARMRREELLGRQIAHEWRLPTVTGTGGRPFTMSGMDIHTPAESDAYRYGEALSPNSETSEAYDTGAAEGAFGGGGGGDDYQPKEWTSMSSAPEFSTEKKARNRSSSLVMFEQEKDERCVNRHNTTRRPPPLWSQPPSPQLLPPSTWPLMITPFSGHAVHPSVVHPPTFPSPPRKNT